MSEKPRWTEGPWEVEEFPTLQAARDDGGFEWTYGMEDQPMANVWQRVIAPDGVSGWTGLPGSIETTLPNAHLIAAAPDLYEALDHLVARVKAMGWPEHEVTLARAALDRARGEAE